MSRMLLAVLACATAVLASNLVTYTHTAPIQWSQHGRVEKTRQINVVFGVRIRNADLIEKMLLDVSNPTSSMWGQHLSLKELRALTADDEAAAVVVSWVRAHTTPATTTIGVTTNADFVKVTLLAGEAESLLSAEFHDYVHGPSGRRHVFSTVYSLPSKVAATVDFVSLSSSVFPSTKPGPRLFELPKQAQVDQAKKPQAFPPPGFVGPQLLWNVYSINPNQVATSAATQSVYENLDQSYSPADLSEFQQTFGLANQPIAQLIGPNNASDCTPNPGDCGEADLDVEYIMAIAQGSPTTFWSIDQNDQAPFVDWIMAVAQDANAPLVHSVSYGDIEPYDDPTMMNRFNTELAKLGVRGITVIVASGDDGVANFLARNNASACGFFPSFPATAPYVTAVGATQGLESNQTEIACTSATGGGITTGGGFSTVFNQPSYQSSVVNNYLQNGPNLPPSSDFNTAGRGYPDVAMQGHNYVTVLGGQYSGADGTSASAPVFAGIITIANSLRINAGKKPLGFLNPTLYNLAATTTGVFNDITSGENNCCAGQPGQQVCCSLGFTATTGWDPLTGLGSVNAQQLFAQLSALP